MNVIESSMTMSELLVTSEACLLTAEQLTRAKGLTQKALGKKNLLVAGLGFLGVAAICILLLHLLCSFACGHDA